MMRQRDGCKLSTPPTRKHSFFTKDGRDKRRVYGLRKFVVESDLGYLHGPERLEEGSLSTPVRFLIENFW